MQTDIGDIEFDQIGSNLIGRGFLLVHIVPTRGIAGENNRRCVEVDERMKHCYNRINAGVSGIRYFKLKKN